MTYHQRRRYTVLVYVFAVMLALPPGFMTPVFAASRTSGLSRVSDLETFRNPQISGASWNRFLGVRGAGDLTGVGGMSLENPGAKGFGSAEGPESLWLTNNGLLEWAETDLSFPGVGMHLVFHRIWRGSVTSYDGPLGEGWEFSWNKRLYEEAEVDGDRDVTFYDMGRAETYTDSSGTYTSPAGRYDTLEKDTTPDPDVFTRTDKWGVVETYEYEGSDWWRLTEIEDLNGNKLSFEYDGNSRLTVVEDTLARDTTLAYDGSGRVTKITDPASRDWEYAYDGSDNLTSVKDPLNKATLYGYDGSANLTSVELPEDDGTPSFTVAYDSGKIASQTINGGTWNITYDTTNRWVTVKDREIADAEVRYHYDESKRIISREIWPDTDGSAWETSYSYNSDNEVTEVIFHRDNEVEYTYDSSGNIVTVKLLASASDASPVTWTYTYTSLNRLSTMVDPNGEEWEYDYDSKGNPTKLWAPDVHSPSGISTSDKNGNGIYDGTLDVGWEYGSTGLVTKYTDPVGTETTYSYTTVNSKSAYLSSVERDSATSGLSLTTSYAYDSAGNVTSVTDPEGNVTTHTLNDNNLVTQTIEPLAVTRTYAYDDNSRLVSVTVTDDTADGDGDYITTTEYDGNNHVTRQIQDLTRSIRATTTLAYDDAERLTKMTDAESIDTKYKYDVRGSRVALTRDPTTEAIESIEVFDGNGNRVTATDPRVHHTVYEYDGYDRLTKKIDPEEHYVTYAHDKAGNVTKTSYYNKTHTKLAETTTSFDEANRVYKTEQMAKKADLSTNIGDGQQTKSIWRDEAGRVIEATGDVCGCSATEYIYDAVGRRVTTKDALTSDQNQVITAYDDNGNVTKVTRKDNSQDTGIEADKDIVTEAVYDARGRAVTRKLRLDASTTFDTVYDYGKRDQVTKVTSPEGDVTKYEHNEALWRTKVTQETAGDDVITVFFYDDEGRMITYRAKNSTTGDQDTEYTYDRVGRMITTTWPDGEDLIQTYDKASNRVSTTDPMDTVVVCSYDDNNRLVSKSISLGTGVDGVDDIDYGYDGLGRMTSADATEDTSFSSVVEWTYNTLGKVETEKQIIDGFNSGNGRTVTYDWNVAGQKTGVTYPVSGDVVTYDRDELDRVNKISRDGVEVVDYTYSGQRIIGKDYPGSYAEYTYDGAGRLDQILHKDTSSGNKLLQLDYGHDDDSQITHVDRLFYDDVQNTRILDDTKDKGEQYGYDGAGRLVTVLKGVPTAYISTAMATNITNGDYDDLVEYHYDQTGNRLTLEVDGTNQVTYAHNKVNEMTTEGATTHTYDDNGNFEGVSNAYTYDFENRLASCDDGTYTWTWHYDALGRLVQRDRSSLNRHQRNYYDGQQIIDKAQYNSGTSAEAHTKSWVYGPRIDELLLYVKANGDEYYAHSDHLGSVMVMADENGAIQESYRYDAWGVPTIVDSSFSKLSQGANSPIANSVMYTGRRYATQAAGSGEDWYNYRARHYRADAGRFVQRDRIRSNNAFLYVLGRPTMAVDPLGLQASEGVTAPEGDKDDGEPCPQAETGSGPPMTCDCKACGITNCRTMMNAVSQKIGAGAIPPGAVSGLNVTCSDSLGGRCGHFDGDSTITIRLGSLNSPLCMMGGLLEVLFHEIGHVLDQGNPHCDPDSGEYSSGLCELTAWNWSCAVLGTCNDPKGWDFTKVPPGPNSVCNYLKSSGFPKWFPIIFGPGMPWPADAPPIVFEDGCQ